MGIVVMFTKTHNMMLNDLSEQVSQVESVMRPHAESYAKRIYSPYLQPSLEPIFTEAFCTQPLLGNVNMTSEQRAELHKMAKRDLDRTLRKTDLPNKCLSDFNCDVLVLETVMLLHNWNEIDDENNNTTFWEYVSNQYDLPHDDSFVNSRAYRIFKTAIKRSMKQHDKLFVSYGQKYYTTMLVHALAPKTKFYALFEQIFSFYDKTLEYQYNKNDPAIRAFAYAMKCRFESVTPDIEDEVHIKSVQSSSAIKALFINCPEYMISFVDIVVCAIDTLVATDTIQEDSYLDTLLLDWYRNRDGEERKAAKRKRSSAGSERAVTEFSNIRVTYQHEKDRVALIIPSIRLGEQSDALPLVEIYRYPNDSAPYSKKLRYYGDYYCITSRKTDIPISSLIADGSDRIKLRVVISHAGRIVYDSGTKLFRDFIIFDDNGNELLKRPDKEYVNVFITEGGELQGEDNSPHCTARSYESGYLFRILIDDRTFITVNGTHLFPLEQKVSGLTLIMSVAPITNSKYLVGQQECTIFTSQPALSITSEDEQFEKKYRLIIDDTSYTLAEYRNNNGIGTDLPCGKGIHKLRIVENLSQRRVYSLSYVVITDLIVNYSGFYYFDNFHNNGVLKIIDNSGTEHYPFKLSPGTDTMLIPYDEGKLAVEIPVLTCHLDGEPVPIDSSQTLWYNDIDMSALLEINTPRGFSASVAVGQRFINAEKVELGNIIRASHDTDVEAVGIIIRQGDGSPMQIKLFDIAYVPQFKSAPLLVESGCLLWCVEENYVGNKDSEFELSVSYKGNEIERYYVSSADEIIPIGFPIKAGVYEYTVYQKASSFFSGVEVLRRDQLILGDPAIFRFDDSALVITEAIMDSERISLKPSSGIIKNLRYIGVQPLNGETQQYPCYEGCLYYMDNGILKPYAIEDFMREGVYHEQVNPIKLWLIDDDTLALRNPSLDGLYIYKNSKSITDRRPVNWRTPEGFVENNYCNPDYYSFKIKELSEVENVQSNRSVKQH